MKEVEIVVSAKKGYALDRVYINPENVSSIENDVGMKQRLEEGQLPDGLDERHQFSKIVMETGQTYTAVGNPTTVQQKLGDRKILHG